MFDWIVGAIEGAGSLGVFLLMLAENIFPPIPSEVVMPLAGYAASRGNVGLVTVIIAGTLGSLAGTSAWYYAGHMLGPVRLRLFAETYGRWLTMTPADIDRAAAWFERSGTWAVLVGRLVPGVRTVVSLPAGIAGMPIGRFLSYSAAGTVVWTAALAISGYVMGQNYARVGGFVEPVSNAMLIVAAVIYLYRVATFGRKNAGR
ncbi:DedA family protein [Rhodopseudomonas palustris]|uniref:DedA family protein n=1 Tax=Rhodopseudomonas palustris TaxID=1076 RepID=A0A323UIH1_RHOPL|nr:DedA family protein [Rhodopseudomonas palustris]PZA12792.1 DedA family protein [Rhodopseudomonas palustris]